MVTPTSLLALLALCMALLVIPSSATSHFLGLRSARSSIQAIPVLRMRGGEGDNHASQLNSINDEHTGDENAGDDAGDDVDAIAGDKHDYFQNDIHANQLNPINDEYPKKQANE